MTRPQGTDRLRRNAWLRTGAFACALLMLSALPLLAQVGTVTGRVTDARTGAPVIGAQVTITGTSLGIVVDADGRFRLQNVPVSAREVRATRIGYQTAAATFALESGGTATVALTLAEDAIGLDALVITGAAGDTRKRAIGNAVATITVSDVIGRSTVSNVMEVLQSKTPGLTLIPGSGSAGVSANYRIRGAGSLYAGNTPVIYLDGVRVSSRGQGNYTVFGQNTASLDAINPNDIESIEVIKGPAAATLYGAEAAAGVIQILTKKGRPGRIRWEGRVETGESEWVAELRPINYAVATAARIADTINWPGFKGKQVGDIIEHRMLSDPGALRQGGLSKLSLSAAGGGDRYSFFVSGSRDQEDGVHLNNFAKRSSIRGNFSFAPSTKLNFNANVNYARNHVRLPLSDNHAQGLIISSYLAIPGRNYAYPAGVNYSTITPAIANTYDNQTRADRFIIGSSAEYKPFDWFIHKVQVGFDMNTGRAELYFPPQNAYAARASLDLDNSKGFFAQGRPLTQDLTLDYDGTVRRDLSSTLVSNSSFGIQYLGTVFRRTDSYGLDLGSAGIRSVRSAAVTSGADSLSEQNSLGFYVQEQLAWRDRVFLTGALRIDNNSAFGSELKRVFYPKASLSYVISEEPFFNLPHVDDLRLRLAWGQAGNSPGPFDALRSYTVSVVTTATGTSSALRYGASGNPNLRPERGTEIEAGFETSLLNGRIGIDATYYNKTTRDALLPVSVPPSTGFAGTRLENLGEISNKGVELMLSLTPIETRAVTLETMFAISTNKNELVSFGDDRAPIIFGSYAPTQRYEEGKPLGAFWAQRVQYDTQGNLVKVAGRPVLDPVSIYMGPSVPTREVSFSTSLRLFDKLRLYGLLDHKGGHYMFNVKDWRRDRAGVSWETADPQADPDEVLVRQFASQTFLHVQKADFIKLRDVSVSYDLPTQMMGRFAASRATLTLAGHNLKIWTDYAGADAELNFNGGDATFNRNDSWTVPMVRRVSASLTVNF
jgi:TonB-dependent starch-binding outer membrane protein SusC